MAASVIQLNPVSMQDSSKPYIANIVNSYKHFWIGEKLILGFWDENLRDKANLSTKAKRAIPELGCCLEVWLYCPLGYTDVCTYLPFEQTDAGQ